MYFLFTKYNKHLVKQLIVAFALLLVLPAMAQNKKVQKADALFATKSFKQAITLYESAVKKSRRPQTIINLAECYRMTNDFERSAHWYKKVIKKKKCDYHQYFNYAKVLMVLHKYDEAKEWFVKYAELDDNHIGSDMAEQCDLILQLMQDSINYKLTVLPSNSRYSDFGATFYDEGFIFASSRENDLLGGFRFMRSKEPFYDLFYVNKNEDNSFSKPVSFSKRINTKFHEGTATFNKNENIIYFTRSNYSGGVKHKDDNGVVRLKIYQAHLVNKSWKGIEEFQYNDDSYSTGYPSLSEDGNTLFFVSDMPGGYGATDIYMCRKQGNGWSKPINLGPKINTEYSEMAPYIHPDGTLYFSSDGHLGFGGLDIYSVSYGNEIFGEISLIKPPINSANDDFGFILDEEKRTGYFSSNRAGGIGDDDIYHFEKFAPDFFCQHKVENNSYSYTFFEENTIATFDLPLAYEWDLGDGTKKRDLEVDHTFAKPGTYIINLNIIDSITGAIFYNEATYQLEIEDIKQVCIDAVDTGIVGTPIIFDGVRSNPENCTIEDYYWDFGDGGRKIGVMVNHTFSKAGNFKVTLGVTGSSGDFTCKSCSYKKIVILDQQEAEELHFDIDKKEADVNHLPIKYTHYQPNKDKITFKVYISLYKKGKHYRKVLNKLKAISNANLEIIENSKKIISCLVGPFEDYDYAQQIKKEINSNNANTTKLIALHAFRDGVQIPLDESFSLLKDLAKIPAPTNYLDNVESVFSMKDNDNVTYKVQLERTINRITPSSEIFDHIENIEEFSNGNEFIYTSGTFHDLKSAYPLYMNAKNLGFGNALVQAFQYNKFTSIDDSSIYLKQTHNNSTTMVTLSGYLFDEDGYPIQAFVNLEDLVTNEILETTQTNPKDGSFLFQLESGKLYGYYAEKEGYFPYSNHYDLRKGASASEITDSIEMVKQQSIQGEKVSVQFNNIFFDFGKSSLSKTSYSELDRLAAFLKKNDHIKVEIIGHTDNVGSRSENLLVSKKRATSVKNYLSAKGYSKENIKILCKGELNPAANNATRMGRAKNRRVEINFIII